MRTRALALVLLLVSVASTACAPSHGVVVGNRDVATDILLKGTPASPAPPPPVQPGFPLAPVPVVLPASGPVVGLPEVPPPPVQQCPSASPLVGARDPATPLPPGPPAARTYSFRQVGTFTVGKSDGTFPAALAHSISKVTSISGGWSYVDTDSSGMTVTYDVYPKQRVASGEPVSTDNTVAQPTEPGIYVRTFTYKRADGTVDTLAPQPELLVAPLPLNNAGATWRARGVDPSTHIAVVVNGQVGAGPKFSPLMDRIDACGTVLQAYWVEYTLASDNSSTTGVNTGPGEPPSSLRGTDLDVTFVGTRVAFAPQYGGIPLEQIDLLKGTDGPNKVAVDVHRREVTSEGQVRPSEDVAPGSLPSGPACSRRAAACRCRRPCRRDRWQPL